MRSHPVPGRIVLLRIITIILCLFFITSTATAQSSPTQLDRVHSTTAVRLDSTESLESAIRRLANMGRLNVVFDQNTKNIQNEFVGSFQVDGVSSLRALEMLLNAFKLTYVPLDRRTILIIHAHRLARPFMSLTDISRKADEIEQSGTTVNRTFKTHDYNFRNTAVAAIIQAIADEEGLNVVFDDPIAKLCEVKKVSFQLKGVSAPRALENFLEAQRLSYVQIGHRTILIAVTSLQNYVYSLPLEEMLIRADEYEGK